MANTDFDGKTQNYPYYEPLHREHAPNEHVPNRTVNFQDKGKQYEAHNQSGRGSRTLDDREYRGYLSTVIVPVLSAGGGYGASTFALQLARVAAAEGKRVCVVDMDFLHGGLDILAGCEEVEGLRWHNVQAPLGAIDPHNFDDELVEWDGVRILPYHPWQVCAHEWWEIKAIYEALAKNFDIIVCDCPQGLTTQICAAWKAVNFPLSIRPILLTRATTLGVARGFATLTELDTSRTDLSAVAGPVAFIAPTESSNDMTIADVEELLRVQVYAQVPFNRRCRSFDKHGWGIAPIKRAYSTVLSAFIHDFLVSS